jgi:NAD(P)-dependent dehydrogenase (short-subunit alcohol dehydrogenase family)
MGNTPNKPAVVWYPEFVEKLPDLSEKVVAVTGSTSGTGLIFAKTCAQKGTKAILMLNRPSERATAAEAQVKECIPVGKTTTVETIACDLQDFESVKAAANAIKAKYEALDVLCNNAGIMAFDDVATKDGYDVQMQTNHLSHFLLTKELFPLLKRAKELRGEARVVHHSSMARYGAPLKREYFGKNGGNLGGNGASMLFNGARWQRYHQTKLANSVFTVALKEKLANTGIKAAVAAPGLSATNLQVTTNQQGGMGSADMMIMHFSQSAEDGTMPLLAACFDPSTENGDFWEPANRGGISGPATKVKYDKQTMNPDNAKLLWEASEEACGKFEIN